MDSRDLTISEGTLAFLLRKLAYTSYTNEAYINDEVDAAKQEACLNDLAIGIWRVVNKDLATDIRRVVNFLSVERDLGVRSAQLNDTIEELIQDAHILDSYGDNSHLDSNAHFKAIGFIQMSLEAIRESFEVQANDVYMKLKEIAVTL